MNGISSLGMINFVPKTKSIIMMAWEDHEEVIFIHNRLKKEVLFARALHGDR